MNWNTLVMILCVLLAVFAVWKEYNRANKSLLWLRILSVLVAIAALACVALPISYSANISASDQHYAILLTDGFNPDSVSNVQDAKLYTADKKVALNYPKAGLIADAAELTANPRITSLKIIGYGLNEAELERLNHFPVQFSPSKTPHGIQSISWNTNLKTGERLRVQGTFKNTSANNVKLILKGLNTGLDSAIVDMGQHESFELSTSPKNAGKAVYNLLAVAAGDTLEVEDLPIQVEPTHPLSILILTASPDFESRFLKSWLTTNGYAVAVRSVISKGKVSKEFINMAQTPLDNLSAAALNKFDVVLGDLSVLRSLAPAEGEALKEEVSQKGLGLIIRADTVSGRTSWLQNGFAVERSSAKEPAPVSLIIQGKKDRSAKLNIGNAYISYSSGSQPLILDDKNHTVAAMALAGSGKLVFTTVNNTFNWMLAGDKDDYAALWSLLISKSARRMLPTESWTVAPHFPMVNSPAVVGLQASSQPSQVMINGSAVSPRQSPEIPFEWNIPYWPTTVGWQSAKQNNGQANWWYAYPKSSWKSQRAAEKIAATKMYAAQNAIVGNVTKPIQQKTRIAVPKIYFYILLLIACTFLWVEGKMPRPIRVNK